MLTKSLKLHGKRKVFLPIRVGQAGRIRPHDQKQPRRRLAAKLSCEGKLRAVTVGHGIPMQVNDHLDGGILCQCVSDALCRPLVCIVIPARVIKRCVMQSGDPKCVEPLGQFLSDAHDVSLCVIGVIVCDIGIGLGCVCVNDQNDRPVDRQRKRDRTGHQFRDIRLCAGTIVDWNQCRVLCREAKQTRRGTVFQQRILLRDGFACRRFRDRFLCDYAQPQKQSGCLPAAV